MKSSLVIMLCVFFVLSASCLHASIINPISYDLPNGQLGGDVPNFFDDIFTGSGNKTTPLASLANGLGDLTDDVVATTNWRGQYLRYIGWHAIDPQIRFRFEKNTLLDSVHFYFDDAEYGGVDNPAGVTISNGLTSEFRTVSDPVGTAPFRFEFNNLGMSGSVFDITLHRRTGYWVMVSEIDFYGSQPTGEVPEPTSLVGFVTLLGMLTRIGLQRTFNRRTKGGAGQGNRTSRASWHNDCVRI